MIVASHNVMHGRRLLRLLPSYRELHARHRIGVLCLQENLADDVASHAKLVQHGLGDAFESVCHGRNERLALVYDRTRLRLLDLVVVTLPKLPRLSPFQRLYIQNRGPEQKYALLARFAHEGGASFTVVNFHLDAAGDNTHRRAQLEVVTQACVRRGLTERLVACGDTNAFTFRRGRHATAYRELLAPLRALGADDPDTRPTHYFARAHEPRLPQRLMVLLGKAGIDMPRRYDVVCSNLPVVERGQMVTPDSDHDLVWARLQLPLRDAAQANLAS